MVLLEGVPTNLMQQQTPTPTKRVRFGPSRMAWESLTFYGVQDIRYSPTATEVGGE